MIKLAIVGRPNVGKSALFNRICKRRIAIEDEAEGVTRDRLYAKSEIFGFPFEVIDTGGIAFHSSDPFGQQIREGAETAIEEADSLIMVVDGQIGVTPLDEKLARFLHKTKKPLTLAVNKIDDIIFENQIHTFHCLGISKIIAVSALQSYQIVELLEMALEGFTAKQEEHVKNALRQIQISIVGRPNVGKSTLINALLKEKRSLVSPLPGTTRDNVNSMLHIAGKAYTLIDTAGVRRKKAENELVDKFATMRREKAIEHCDVCLLLLDASEGMTTQDKRLATQIEKAGKSCIVLMNKWDLVKGYRMEHCVQMLHKQCPFLIHCPILFTSGKTGRNLDKIFDQIDLVNNASKTRISTHQLNKFVQKAMQQNFPPMIGGKRLRIYYLTQVEITPPRFIFFVNNPSLMSQSYKRYLINQFRSQYSFPGTPIEFHLHRKS